MFLTGPSAEIASSMTKAIIWLLRRCFSRRTSAAVCRYVERNLSAGRIISQGRGLALVKRCGWGIAECKALADAAGSMAGPRSVGLDAVGGPAGESEGVGGITPIGNAWMAIRRRRLGAADGRPAAPGIEPARPAPASLRKTRGSGLSRQRDHVAFIGRSPHWGQIASGSVLRSYPQSAQNRFCRNAAR